jgi:serine protease Do
MMDWKKWLLLVAVLFGLVLSAEAQTDDPGKHIYASSEASVFLIYINDASGTPTALGSGFLVAPQLLVTNHHVVEGGEPVLAVGPARIPLKIVSIDTVNDLAVVSVGTSLTSTPLPLAPGEVKPGEQVYAIGNPQGLEKTISQGIVSGLRERDGRKLIQVTAPISHGSSGGPVLNAKGEVVGVAVGMLEDGQNLNFAVPVDYVRTLLAHKDEPQRSLLNPQETMTKLTSLKTQRQKADYSDEPNSTYQTLTHQIHDLISDTLQKSNDENLLKQAACIGIDTYDLSDDSIAAARKLSTVKPSPESEAVLAWLLYSRSTWENLAAAFQKEGSEEQKSSQAERKKYLSEARETALHSNRTAKGDALLLTDFVMANADVDNGQYAEAIPLHTRVASGHLTVCDENVATMALRKLISDNADANHPEEAERWFQEYANKFDPSAYEWNAEGDRRETARDKKGSATAWEKAAAIQNSGYGYDYCYAANARWWIFPQDSDKILTDGRACVSASVNNTDKDDAKYFDTMLPTVYTEMAEVLEQRGVYQSALEYSKEALSLKPDFARAYATEADIYYDLQRFTECIAASQQAIQFSDGKFSFMHFRLGTCYFSTQNYAMAENSFRIAAQDDTSDPSSAFNLGLALLNEERTVEGNQWLREALKRNPDAATRDKILNLLR